jgi:cation:H+ antiporter
MDMVFLQLLLLALGFFLLVKGADWFVEGTSGIADKFGIPQLVIGLTIVAMGTSAPETAVSITAALKGTADIAIGNVVGSNILNVLIILGISSVITSIAVAKTTVRYEIPIMLGITLLMLGFGANGGTICLWEGIVLLLCFVAYLGYMFVMVKKGQMQAEEIESGDKPIW